jgi:hypothetical protein
LQHVIRILVGKYAWTIYIALSSAVIGMLFEALPLVFFISNMCSDKTVLIPGCSPSTIVVFILIACFHDHGALAHNEEFNVALRFR